MIDEMITKFFFALHFQVKYWQFVARH